MSTTHNKMWDSCAYSQSGTLQHSNIVNNTENHQKFTEMEQKEKVPIMTIKVAPIVTNK